MTKSQFQKILLLRLLIGFLGEQNQFRWWQTSFFNASSEMFLQPVFSKTFRLAQYQGIKEAAKRIHDEHIGVGQAAHLFRLSEEIEQELHKTLLEDQFFNSFLHNLKSIEIALLELKKIADQASTLKEGPVAIGRFDSVSSSAAVKSMAQFYLGAFEANAKTYPYFIN